MRKLWYINRFGDSALPSQLLPRKFAIRTCLSDTSNEFLYSILGGSMDAFYQEYIKMHVCLQLKFQSSNLAFLYTAVNNILQLYKKCNSIDFSESFRISMTTCYSHYVQ